MKSDQNEAKNTQRRISRAQSKSITRKMSSTPQQDSHHSVDAKRQQPLSLDGGLNVEISGTDYCHLNHPKRDLNSLAIERNMEEKINFPPPNDKTWEKVND